MPRNDDLEIELQKFFKKKFLRDDNVRYSNERGDAGGPLASLEKELPRFADNIKKAAKFVENVFGKSSIERTYKKYYKAIEDATEELNKQNKKYAASIAKSYEEAMKANSINFKAQQAITNNLREYNKRLEVLNKLTKYDEDISKEDKATKHRLIRQVNEELEVLRQTLKKSGSEGGIGKELEDFRVAYNRHTKQYEGVSDKAIMHIRDFNSAFEDIVNDSEVFAKRLKEAHAEELEAKKAFAMATYKAVEELTTKSIGIINSRLRGLQTDTQSMQAILRGMSGEEINAWMQENRRALVLQGEGATGQYDVLARELKSYGFIGKDAAGQITKLNSLLMRTGSQANASNAMVLQNGIAQLQALEQMTPEEATARATEMLTSVEMLSLSLGKNDAERLNIQHEQLNELTQISRATGFSASYGAELLKMQREVKYKDAISKIMQAVGVDLALGEYQRMSGTNLTAQQQAIFKKGEISTQALTPEEFQIYAATKKQMGGDIERLKTRQSIDAAYGNYGAVAGMAALEKFFDMGSLSMRGMGDDYVTAEAVKNTEALAAQQMSLDSIVAESKKSNDLLEKFLQGAAETFTGIKSSPLGNTAGGAMNVIGGLASGALDLYMLRELTRQRGGAGTPKPGVGRMGGGLKGKLLGGLLMMGGMFGGASAANYTPDAPPPPSSVRAAASASVPRTGMEGIKSALRPGNMLKSGLKGGVIAALPGIAGSLISGYGSGLRQEGMLDPNKNTGNAIENILDKETGGAMLDTAGRAVQWGATGAAVGALLGPIGAAVGGGVGLLGGAISGLVDNWDTVESNFGQIFGESKASTRELMTSGATIDDNGNVIIDPQQDRLVEVFNRVADNTEKTNEIIEGGISKIEEENNVRRRVQEFTAKRQAQATSLMSQHAGIVDNANAGVASALAAYDS